MGRINKPNKAIPVSADEFIIYDSEDTSDDKNVTLGQIATFTESQNSTVTGSKIFSGGVEFQKGSIAFGQYSPLPTGLGSYVAQYTHPTYGARLLGYNGSTYQDLSIGSMPTAGTASIKSVANGDCNFGYNVNIAEDLDVSGNVTSTKFYGDGSELTGIIELRNIIKSCKLDSNGECDLLENPQGQQEVILQYPKPLLSSDGTIGVSQFATFVSHPYSTQYGYKMFDGGLDVEHMACTNPQYYVNGYMGWHCLNPLCVKSLKIINDTYSGSYTLYGGYLQGSNDTTDGSDGTWTNIARFDNTNHNLGGEWYITASSNTTYYNAYRFFLDAGGNYQRIGEVEFEDVIFVAQAAAGSSVIVQSTSTNPLIYVNPDGTTSTITSQNSLDFSSGYADGKYPLIQLSDGTVDVASSYTESKTEPTNPTNNDYWFNTSVIPNTLQKYVTSEWVEKQGVFIGSVNVASNLVTSVEQPVIKPNNGVGHTVVETYKNGNSWYRVYSDGWCEQGGIGTENVSTALLKTYTDTNYQILLTIAYHENTNSNIGVYSKTTSSFVFFIGSNLEGSGTAYWHTCGYIS